MKKQPLLALSALMLIGGALASCGPTDPGSSRDSTPSVEWEDDSTDDLVYDGNGNIVFDEVELSMWSVCTNPDSVYQDQIIDDFNRAYDGQIHVTVYHESRYSIFSNLVSTVAQDPDNAPDLFYGYGDSVGSSRDVSFIFLKGVEPSLHAALASGVVDEFGTVA